jgi:hypothetical protein
LWNEKAWAGQNQENRLPKPISLLIDMIKLKSLPIVRKNEFLYQDLKKTILGKAFPPWRFGVKNLPLAHFPRR